MRFLWNGFGLLVLVMLGAACSSDGPGGPTPPAGGGSLIVTPDSIVAGGVGQSLSFSVTRDGRAVSGFTLAVRAERRWLDDRAVVDAGELAGGRLATNAPGRVVIDVSAQGSSDSLIVVVQPSRPLILEWLVPGGRTHLGAGDTLRLRGFRLDQVTAANLALAGGSAVVTARDSANLRFTLPPAAPATTCGGVAPALGLTLTGIDGTVPAGLTRKRADEITLAAGEAKRLTDAEAACIRLTPANGARYILAYADTRLTTKAQTTAEWPWPDSIAVTVADRSTAMTALRALDVTRPAAELPGMLAAQPHRPVPGMAAIHSAASGFMQIPVGCPFNNIFFSFCRATPWTLGEAFPYYPAGSARPAGQARVIALRGNLVLAVFLADSSMLGPRAVARADSALQFMANRAAPFYRSVFGLAGFAKTSDESGQLLLMLEQSSTSFAQWWPDPATGHGRWGKLTIGLSPNSAYALTESSAAFMLGIQGHEAFHTYQYRWRFDVARPWITVLGTSWAVEGGATFMALELTREFLNVPFLSNYPLPAGVAVSDPFFSFVQYGWEVRDFTAGYNDAASLMRDLVQRLVADGGLSFDDAVREVLAGSLEGWWGINEEGQRTGPGLTARMRARLGAGWNPVDALLDWTMSGAADDLTSNPRYQNRTIRATTPGTQFNMFRPHAVVRNGASFTVRRAPGNTGVFELADGPGGSYAAAATVAGAASEALEWLLLRIN
jgi:hypothetical protein